jgi:hypothetical protein
MTVVEVRDARSNSAKWSARVGHEHLFSAVVAAFNTVASPYEFRTYIRERIGGCAKCLGET